MSHVDERTSYTEEALAACRALGRARVVLRNALGLSEAFVDLAELELRDGWAHLCTEAVHVHLVVSAIAELRIEAGICGPHTSGPAVWFSASSGVPLLLIVLDQTNGPARHEQKQAFAQLLATYGARRALVSAGDVPDRSTMS